MKKHLNGHMHIHTMTPKSTHSHKFILSENTQKHKHIDQ